MAKRIDTAEKTIPAPPSAVYAAFSAPGAMERWMAPAGMTATMLHFDFREGGSYRMRLTYGDAGGRHGKTTQDSDAVEVRFTRLAEGREIGQAVDFESEDPGFRGTMRMTWVFEPEGEGTRVTVRAEDVPAGIKPEDHKAGMESTLENLRDYLARGGR